MKAGILLRAMDNIAASFLNIQLRLKTTLHFNYTVLIGVRALIEFSCFIYQRVYHLDFH